MDTAREETRSRYAARQEQFDASREVLTDEERETWEDELLTVRCVAFHVIFAC